MKKILFSLILAVALLAPAGAAYAQETPNLGEVVLDIAIVRPFHYVIMAGGVVLYPFAWVLDPLFRDDPELLKEELLTRPYKCAIERPIGKFDC